MKKVIIGVHGLGNKPPKYLLKRWWQKSMLEGLKKGGHKKVLPEFELVYWADILYDEPLNLWESNKESPYYLYEPYKKSPKDFYLEDHPITQKIVGFISDQLNRIFLNPDMTLNHSFITDAILKRYFRDLEIYYNEECKDEFDMTCKAKELIRRRVVDTIYRYRDYEIMIIAHSMGSIITFDALTFVIPEIKINTLVTIGSPLGLPVVVSKIAAEQKKMINGKSIMSTPPGVTDSWYNLADILDRVALNYKLGDDFNKNENGVIPRDYLVQNDYEIDGDKNHHKSYGYLRTPEFSNILNEFIGDEKLSVTKKVFGKVQQIVENMKLQSEKVRDRLNID